MLSCACYYYLEIVQKKIGRIIWLLYSLLFVYVLYKFIYIIYYRINDFQIWDFTSWFLWAKVAVQGLNFYLPENSQYVFNSLNFPVADFSDFTESIVDVGFLYPPPTMLLFYFLGFLSYNSGLVLWTVIILIFLVGCIYLVSKFYFKENGIRGLLLASILFLIYPSVNFTLICSQTNFMVLFYLLLMRKYSSSSYAGIILALAFFTKPFMLILGLFFVLSKNWKAILSFVLSSILLSIISIILFGFKTFISYFTNNATQRLPKWQFSEDINQSLHAVLLRANLISLDNQKIYLIIVVLILSLVLLFSMYFYKRQFFDSVWAMILLVGLLIYPGTLSYYGVALLFVFFQFFRSEGHLGLNPVLTILVTGLLFYLDSVSVFSSICLLMLVVLFSSTWHNRQMNLNSSIG